MLTGRSPNAGRFCGNCYNPLQPDRTACRHCGVTVADTPTVKAVPRQIIEAHRVRRSREGNVVRSVAWGGLTLGVVLALIPLAFAGVRWWTFVSFFVVLFGFYVLSANLANTVGDAMGYRWGLSTFRKRWERYKAEHAVSSS